MITVELFLLSIGSILVKALLVESLGNAWQSQVSQDLVDLLKEAASDKIAQRRS
ncbi:MAG: hypothetical protein IPK16_29355 [Anaerolineales bacterium]|nr:hypothetical protein [Anaerolineales bacterium]